MPDHEKSRRRVLSDMEDLMPAGQYYRLEIAERYCRYAGLASDGTAKNGVKTEKCKPCVSSLSSK